MKYQTNSALRFMGRLHDRVIHQRRVHILCGHIAPWLVGCHSLIDVGCGDGLLTASLQSQDLSVQGYDVSARPRRLNFPIETFDGLRLPIQDSSVDAVLLVDVLHHSENPKQLLAECRRVARRLLIIKDHRLSRPGAKFILKAMDWIANRPHSVDLRGNYWTEAEWRHAWQDLRLTVKDFRTNIGLYPSWARPFFEDGLHFLACLCPNDFRA